MNHHFTILNPLYQKMFCVWLELIQWFFKFCIILHVNKLKSFFTKGSFMPSILETWPSCCGIKNFLKFTSILSPPPLENGSALRLYKSLNFLCPSILCARWKLAHLFWRGSQKYETLSDRRTDRPTDDTWSEVTNSGELLI